MIDEVADEYGRAALGMGSVERPPGRVPLNPVAERPQQLDKLSQAAVHIADDVERPGAIAVVDQQPVPDD